MHKNARKKRCLLQKLKEIRGEKIIFSWMSLAEVAKGQTIDTDYKTFPYLPCKARREQIQCSIWCELTLALEVLPSWTSHSQGFASVVVGKYCQTNSGYHCHAGW